MLLHFIWQRSRYPGCTCSRVTVVYNQGLHSSDRLVWIRDGSENSHSGAGVLSLRLPSLAGKDLLDKNCRLLSEFRFFLVIRAHFHGAAWAQIVVQAQQSYAYKIMRMLLFFCWSKFFLSNAALKKVEKHNKILLTKIWLPVKMTFLL